MQETRLKENREVSREEIERRAFEIYIESGMEAGHDVEHWLQAEQQLLGAAPESGPTDDIRVFEKTPVPIGKAAAASGGSSSGG
jgi:hypothetical protein